MYPFVPNFNLKEAVMETVQTVVDGKFTYQERGALQRRFTELVRRIGQGSTFACEQIDARFRKDKITLLDQPAVMEGRLSDEWLGRLTVSFEKYLASPECSFAEAMPLLQELIEGRSGEWTIWKTVYLGGNHLKSDSYLTGLKGYHSDQMWRVVQQTSGPRGVANLVRISEDTLGFSKGCWPLANRMVQAVQDRGLRLCTPEIGPQCYLQISRPYRTRWAFPTLFPVNEETPCLSHFRKRPKLELELFNDFNRLKQCLQRNDPF